MLWRGSKNAGTDFLGSELTGFYSLDDELAAGKDRSLKKRNESFLKNTAVLLKAENNHENKAVANPVHLKRIYDLIEKSKAKGIHLFFVIPARTGYYDQLLPFKQSIPTEHLVDLDGFRKYPLLYDVSNNFDAGHLNKAGANLYTLYFANEMKGRLLTD